MHLESVANLCHVVLKQNLNIHHTRVYLRRDVWLGSTDLFVIGKTIKAKWCSQKCQVHLKQKIRKDGLFLGSWSPTGYEWLSMLDNLIKHNASNFVIFSEQSAKPSKSTEHPRQGRKDHAPSKGCWKGERAKRRRCHAEMIRGWKRTRLHCLKLSS